MTCESLWRKVRCHFNLFTSFGYFENDEDNLTTLIAIKESLSEYGFAVIMNVSQVLNTLFPEKNSRRNWFSFETLFKDGHYKEIDFEDKGQKFHLLKSKALTLQDFEGLMEEAGIYL
jgi:hypothetical protein